MPHIAFITNFCPHYRVRTFETLAKYHQMKYFFFSEGEEWYWQRERGTYKGGFDHEYLAGFQLGNTRITPDLPVKLWKQNYDIYIKCIDGPFALLASYLIARLKRKPFILWTGIWMRLQSPVHKLAFPLTCYIYRHADAVVAYGLHIKRYLISEGVSAERVFVAPHAVDNSAYNRFVSKEETDALRLSLGIPENSKVILYVGRLEKEKGLEYLIDAFSSLKTKDAVLVLAGNGSLQPHLEEIVRRRGLSRLVRFVGHLSPQETVAYYAMAWASLLPSITTNVFKEPWGLVVNEAMNQGTPVIVTDSVGAAAGGLVEHNVNGLVVSQRNTQELAAALVLILNSPELRQKLSQQARKIIAEWDNERMVMGFRDAIQFVDSRGHK